MTLTEFLAARLDEDEAGANACEQSIWGWSGPPTGYPGRIGWHLIGFVSADANGSSWYHLAQGIDLHDPSHTALKHAARHDPARVLREVEAKRKILATQPQMYVMRALAAVYSDHPEFEGEWSLSTPVL